MSTILSSLVGISASAPGSVIYSRAVPVTFAPTYSASPIYDPTYQLIWQFGDASVSYEQTPTHTYTQKGVYPVSYTVIIPNSAIGEVNDEMKTVTMMVSVFNYIEDAIVWTSGAAGTFQAVPQSTPFVLSLSSSNVDSIPLVQLYSRGSRSQPWQEPQQKWSHLKPQWRFTDLSGTIVSDIQPLTYTTLTLDVSGNRTFDGSGTIVGTSAQVQCYYIDDMPSLNIDNSITPVTLVATLITSAYTVDENTVKYVPGYLNSDIYSENSHTIKFLQPTHLRVSVNGITPFGSVIWLSAFSPYTVTVHANAPYDDVILKNFPQVNFTVNTFTQGQSGITFDTPIEFVRFDSDGFDTGGYFRGTFTPLLTTDSIQVSVSGTVSYSMLAEPFGAWLSNPHYNEALYLTVDNAGSGFLSSIYVIPDSQIYGIARVTGDLNDTSWFTDPTNDKVYRISRSFGVDREFDLDSYSELSAVVLNNDYGLTPTGIVLNAIKQPWVSLFDGVSTIKFNPDTGAIMAIAVPPSPDVNQYIDVPGLSGFGGDDTVRPAGIEINVDNELWVAYNHPLSSFICKYNDTGTFVRKINLPIYSKPYGIVCDKNNNLWVTLSYSIGALSGQIVQYDTDGNLLNALSGFRAPSYVTLDHLQNAWFVHGYNLVTRVDAVTFTASTFTLSSTTLPVDPPTTTPANFYDQELGGIACDWYNRIWVLNSYDNQVYMIVASAPASPITELQISPFSNDFNYSLQGFGDWMGLQWYNKFGAIPLSAVGSSVTLNLSGASNGFAIKDFNSSYDIRKINEDFDGVNKIRDITLQQNIKNNDVLFDKLIAPIAGTYDGDPLQLGTVIYEKTANFVGNQGDVDTCNIPALYSLHELVDTPIDRYDLSYPADIKRLMDLLSITLTRLKSTRNAFAKDFKKYNVASSGRNIGKQLPLSATVNVGDKIVSNIKYSTYYEVLEVTPITEEVMNNPALSADFTWVTTEWPLSSYQLKDFYGWGLDTPVSNYYFFYEYIPGTDGEQVEGVIDWDNTNTTLMENISSVDEWYKDGGIVDLIFNYHIFKGLGLIKD